MRVAHFCRFSPHKSGQYSTVKDLIKAEREVGIDAGILATVEQPQPGPGGQGRMTTHVQPGLQDEWLISQDPQWAADADIFVRHTIIPPEFEVMGKPIIMLLHGRPENSWLLGAQSKVPVYSIITTENAKNNYKAFVTLWPEFMLHWSTLVDKHKLFCAPAPVDLDHYNPEGPTGNFGSESGTPDIIVVDMWREDTTPYNVIHAASYFKRNFCPEAKLHVFACNMPPFSPTAHLMELLHNDGIVGRIYQQVPNLNEVYRSADLLITPHTIATRIVREALASGLPIVAGGGCPYTPYGNDPRDTKGYAQAINGCWKAIQDNREAIKKKARKTAEKYFSLKESGEAMKTIFERSLTSK